MASPSFQQQLLERALRLQAQARARPPPPPAPPGPAAILPPPPPRPAVLEASQLPSVQRAVPAVGPERLQELQQLARPPPPPPPASSGPRAPSEAVKRKLQDLRPQQKSIPKRPFELYLKDWKDRHPEFASRKKEARALASQAYKVESRAVLKQYDERARALQLQQRAEMELDAFSPDLARREAKTATVAAASSDMVMVKRPRPPASSSQPPKPAAATVAAPPRAPAPNEAFLAELERQLFPPGT